MVPSGQRTEMALTDGQSPRPKKACGAGKSCRVRGFTCLIGQAGKELYLVHCESANQTHFVRFEYGS